MSPSRKRRKVKEYVDHMTAAEIRALESLLRGEYPAPDPRWVGCKLREYVRNMAEGLSSERFVCLLNKSKDTVRDRVAAPPEANPVRANGSPQ
eukprot:COSAG04_NODE_203_length_20431_cov_12.598269_6_plen_93_part_00